MQIMLTFVFLALFRTCESVQILTNMDIMLKFVLLLSKNELPVIPLQILIGSIPTFSENFIQIYQVWPQLNTV